LLVQADSRYVIDAATKWLTGWKRRGWTTATGTPVKNLDLFRQLDELLATRHVSFEHVYGHSGHPANERADTLARDAAVTQQDSRS
jgi:ribonuclease HI